MTIIMEKIKVFCLPYAGGSSSIYFDWKEKYASMTEIIPVEYSGHGSLFGEPLYMDADALATDICNKILSEKPQNYIIYGHSMGSMIGLLVIIKLEQKGYAPLPKCMIAGGTRPPHLKHKDEQLSHLPKDIFMKKIFDLGEMDAEILSEPDLVDMLYDIIYADMKLSEDYKHDESLPKISIPMVIMTGSEDIEAPLDEMKEWKTYTSNNFYIKEFDADHFFPFKHGKFGDYFLDMIDKANKSLL